MDKTDEKHKGKLKKFSLTQLKFSKRWMKNNNEKDTYKFPWKNPTKAQE